MHHYINGENIAKTNRYIFNVLTTLWSLIQQKYEQYSNIK